MKKVRVFALVAVTLMVLALAGCYTIDAPVNATSNPVGDKVGESSGTLILGAFGNVDASIREAAANGGVSEISTVDLEVKNVLGIIQTFTTTVTGE
jgi:outer membrane lipoprotein SlyB